MGQGYLDDTRVIGDWLRDPANAEPCAAFPADADRVRQAGVYAFHGDAAVNGLIERELRHRATPLYVDQAGADAPRTGRRSGATLHTQILRHHLRGSPRAANFRRSIASLLWKELELRCERPQVLEAASNARLSAWMLEHLRVATVPVEDRSKLCLITAHLVDLLDPPLNLSNLANTPGRKRLRALRSRHFSWSSADADRIERLSNLYKFARRDPENEFIKRRIAQESEKFFGEMLAESGGSSDS